MIGASLSLIFFCNEICLDLMPPDNRATLSLRPIGVKGGGRWVLIPSIDQSQLPGMSAKPKAKAE